MIGVDNQGTVVNVGQPDRGLIDGEGAQGFPEIALGIVPARFENEAISTLSGGNCGSTAGDQFLVDVCGDQTSGGKNFSVAVPGISFRQYIPHGARENIPPEIDLLHIIAVIVRCLPAIPAEGKLDGCSLPHIS
jgi:hypothetical protein